jgi:hypothetical protein
MFNSLLDMPDGIISQLTREYSRNLHDGHVWFLREGDAGRQSTLGAYDKRPDSLQRMLLIWKLIHICVQLVALQIFRAQATMAGATTL